MVHVLASDLQFSLLLQLKIRYVNSPCIFEAIITIHSINTRATKIIDKFVSIYMVACLLLVKLMSIKVMMQVELQHYQAHCYG